MSKARAKLSNTSQVFVEVVTMCETTCDRARKGDLRKKGGSRTLLQTTWLHHHVGFLAAVSHQDYSFVELDNKLKAIIGSDPECDKVPTGGEGHGVMSV